MLKKIVSALFISLLMLSMVPTVAFASESVSALEANAPGGNVSTTEELVAALGSVSVAYENGEITLYRDIVLSASINITSGTYVIKGAGATVKSNFSGPAFVIAGEGTTLTIGDRDASENRSGLTFDGENSVRDGAFFEIGKGGKLEMYNSVIIKELVTSTSGAAIYNEGEFVMYGGEIINCRASSSGGAIYNAGTLTLSAGTVKDCSANDGGAVFTEVKSTFIGTVISGCKAENGGALYNMGEMDYLSGTITECSATAKGGALYNGGKAVIKGGTINGNTSLEGMGGGVYNASELELYGSVLHKNSAENGGNLFNSGNADTKESFMMTGGIATENGGNIYNDKLGIFTHNSGGVSAGKALCGGGVYNFGTYNLNGGGVYANKAEAAEGILNNGRLVLSNTGYCEKGDDILVVLTPENEHAIIVADNWSYNGKPIPVSCGVYRNGQYTYSHSVGAKILNVKGKIDVSKRFMLHVGSTGLVISGDGALEKAPTPISKTFTTVICIAFAYPLVTAIIVLGVRYFDKKNGAK